jgi:LytS/YehU family sensor histidine kinase
MELSEKGRNRIFWLLQLGGWGFVNLFSVLILKEMGTEFFLFSMFSGILSGILSTTPVRYYLRNRITFERFGWREAMQILGAILAGAFLYGVLSFIAGFLYGYYGNVGDNEVVRTILKTYNSWSLMVSSSLIMISMWVLCYLAIKLLLKLNKDRVERLELNDSLKQARLNTLKGQINPHFMFNSLNNIRGLMLEDVDRSREMLTKLSEMLRYSLTENDINATTLEQELEIVTNYIDLSKIQLEERLQFKKEVDPESLSVEIPPMVVQLLVENAVKHGISAIKQGGEILLKTRVEEGLLRIEVLNDGRLNPVGKSTGLGLKNIRQRLKLLYGTEAGFRIAQLDQKVLAEIKIPIR